jgi:hypothetical protein
MARSQVDAARPTSAENPRLIEAHLIHNYRFVFRRQHIQAGSGYISYDVSLQSVIMLPLRGLLGCSSLLGFLASQALAQNASEPQTPTNNPSESNFIRRGWHTSGLSVLSFGFSVS